ncbi:MAG TPA: DNA polymerase Y family protein [Burkholderiales bacterium]|nr:DNA polymerase Y family protein [Burkholderiales bacterium]
MLEAIAAWACRFTPKVSLEPPQELLLEVQGSLRLFEGEAALLAQLRQGLEAMGFPARLATAPAARGALWLARSGVARLEAVPVEVICAPEELAFLHSVGITTVDELGALPREGLGRRCGPRLLEALEHAFGRSPEPRSFFAAPPRFAVRLDLQTPVTQAEALLFAGRRLLVQLEGLLAARQAGVRRFTLVLIPDRGAESSIEIALASPARASERLAAVLRERLSRLRLAQPVEAVRVEAADFIALDARTAGLFGDAAVEAEDWACLVERLRARLGHEAVCGLAAQPDHRPEHAWRRVEPGEWDPRDYRPPGPRPLWLLEPRRLEEGAFDLLAGPERIESGWWDGDDAARDYFVARLPGASLGWIYREAGEWFLHGLFA